MTRNPLHTEGCHVVFNGISFLSTVSVTTACRRVRSLIVVFLYRIGLEIRSMLETSKMNDNLHHSRAADGSSQHNGGYGGLELEKMNPLGELSFFFGERSSAGDHHQQQQRQQQQQQQPAKRSMDDVLKKLTSKMHISHSPVLDEADPFNKDRSVGLCAYTTPYSISVCIHTQSSKILLKWGNYLSSLALHLLRSSTKGGSPWKQAPVSTTSARCAGLYFGEYTTAVHSLQDSERGGAEWLNLWD